MSNTRVAVWSVDKNRLVNEMSTSVRSTKDPNMFAAQKGKYWLPVWPTDSNLQLTLDKCYSYVCFE